LKKFFEATNKKIFKILVCKFKMFLYFAFSIGIEMDFTTVYYLLTSILIYMTTKVNNMTTTINMANVLCVMGCGAQLESPTIPIARNEFISILSRNKRSAWEGNLPLSTIWQTLLLQRTLYYIWLINKQLWLTRYIKNLGFSGICKFITHIIIFVSW